MSKKFSDFEFSPSVLRGIEAIGFVEPRPIQASTIPAALAGRDILGLAQTGTGKTAAFALPILERLISDRVRGTSVLVVAPTRELASQISQEFRVLARFTKLRVATIFGGVGINPQIRTLRDQPEIVVACPGRLLDLVRQRAISLREIETLVLDEADHMFDMGFLPDIRRILAQLPAKRQNLLFSATMPREIRKLADEVLRDPFVVELSHSRPASTVEHALYPIAESQKMPLLEHVLKEDGFVSAIVFTRTKHRAKRLAQRLEKLGLRAIALQGNMSQNQRERAMEGFRRQEFDVLVATDIAARGLDIEQVSHVINYDMPNTADAYTHRIGRTGRSEREGVAYTFITDADGSMVRMVERKVGQPIERRTVDGLPKAVPTGDRRFDGDADRSRSNQRNSGGRGRGHGGSGRGSAAGRAGSGRGNSSGSSTGSSSGSGRGTTPSNRRSRPTGSSGTGTGANGGSAGGTGAAPQKRRRRRRRSGEGRVQQAS